MAQKQPIPIPFSQGLSQKNDPKQIPIGKFSRLKNSIFNKIGLLQKRPGYGNLASLPNTSSTFATTYSGGLTAIGTSVEAYSAGASQWFNRGLYTACDISVLPAVRSSTNQTQCDSVIAPNGIACVVFTDTGSGSTTYKYSILDSYTGQVAVVPTTIPVVSGTVTGSPRVFLVGNYFVIVFTNVITGVSHLQYIAIGITTPSSHTTAQNITSSYISSPRLSWDGFVANNVLYLAYNTTTGGQAIKVTSLTSSQAASGSTPATAVTFAGSIATLMSVTVDITISTAPIVWVSFYDSVSQNGYTLAVDKNLNIVLAPTQYVTGLPILNIISIALNSLVSVYQEVSNNYSYDSGVPTNYIQSAQVSQAGALISSNVQIRRSIGLASKGFLMNGVFYFLGAYQSAYQPSYFLINGDGKVIGKLAYSNGGGYLALGLPNVTIRGSVASVSYLFKDLITAVNKSQGLANSAGIYSQTGLNIASFDFDAQINTSEVAGNLNITGAQLWTYDGQSVVEQGFHVWPDMDTNLTTGTSKALVVSHAGGSMITQDYFYQAVYSWTDNTGKVHYSAPSIPVPAASASFSGSLNSVTINVPTLRLTAKTLSPVSIQIYRWSTAQQSYYQVTSVATPLLNNTSVDSVSFVDTQSDSQILGNALIYTTGGILENIGSPAAALTTLHQGNLVVLDAEDRNLLWISKPVLEATPVELSDLLTLFVSPTTGAQGSTGDITALSSMDDKLIIFKRDAIYYVTGQGFTATGQGGFSEPVFITGTVGCSNQRSIVMTPMGLLFQSDKGIWLLGRDLQTSYKGNPVEDLTATALATSALCIPGANYVLFGMNSGIDIIYDYFADQWGTHEGTPSTSATLFSNLRTLVNKYGQVLQQTPNKYLDGSNPVLIGLSTGWINAAGLQGYLRAYDFYLLGKYLSPHGLNVNLSYDYEPSSQQEEIIYPTNSTVFYGDDFYGGETPYGGGGSLEQWKVSFTKQKCQAFMISIDELFDASKGIPPGAGLTLSGLNLTVGMKKGWVPIAAINSVGGNG